MLLYENRRVRSSVEETLGVSPLLQGFQRFGFFFRSEIPFNWNPQPNSDLRKRETCGFSGLKQGTTESGLLCLLCPTSWPLRQAEEASEK